MLSTDANGATDSDAVAITVSSVNDGPVNTVPGAQTVNEDTALSIAGISRQRRRWQPRHDAADGDQRRAQRQPGGRGDDQRGRERLLDPDASGTQAQINAALASLSYQGNADFNGARHADGAVDRRERRDRLRRGRDHGDLGERRAGEHRAGRADGERRHRALDRGVSVNDVDGNLSTTQLTVTNGTLTVSLAGGATISAGANGTSTLTLSGTQAQINAALASLSYQGNADFNGSDTLTVLSTDANGATDSDAVAITVSR